MDAEYIIIATDEQRHAAHKDLYERTDGTPYEWEMHVANCSSCTKVEAAS
jgi:hypothetical protein